MPTIEVTGVVLAGGQGSRMGGVDKGLQPFRGKPMVAHAVERLGAQVDELLINANRNPEAYAAFGHRVIADEMHFPLALFVTPVDRAPDGNAFPEERPHWSPFHSFTDD